MCKSTSYENSSEPLADELCYFYIVFDAKLVLYMLHVVVVCMQAHAIVLQSVEPVHGTRTARVYVAVAVLFFDVVVEIQFFLEG